MHTNDYNEPLMLNIVDLINHEDISRNDELKNTDLKRYYYHRLWSVVIVTSNLLPAYDTKLTDLLMDSLSEVSIDSNLSSVAESDWFSKNMYNSDISLEKELARPITSLVSSNPISKSCQMNFTSAKSPRSLKTQLKDEIGADSLPNYSLGPLSQKKKHENEEVHPLLKNLDPKIIEQIQNEVIVRDDKIGWDDIIGLDHAKKTINEIIIWPMQRPDLFKGLRGPPMGLLLFGPPGTGKTLIGKCIASQAGATFFSISASSLTSKWYGEAEKLVRTLFAVARVNQPSVIFIDEIDSLLTQRADDDSECSRRIKTEFLVQFDGTATSANDRLLIIGATNRPHELDDAARRRLVKRLYIPLPDSMARINIVKKLLIDINHSITDDDFVEIAKITDGYSGSDLYSLCREASLQPLRDISNIIEVNMSDVRPVTLEDIRTSLTQVRASVSMDDLDSYIKWNNMYGSLG